MSRSVILLLIAFVAVACSETGSVDSNENGTVPRAAISSEALAVDWVYSVREVTSAIPLFEGEVTSYIGDGEVVFETEDGRDGIALSVENLDPSASEVCHPNGLILDGDCPERADSPYVLFESSPVLELIVNGRSCVAPRDSSAIELRVDDEHRLLRARTIAPVICPGAEAKSYEITLEPIELAKEDEEITLTLGSSGPEPTLINDEGNPIP